MCLSDQQVERWHPSKPSNETTAKSNTIQSSVWKAKNIDIREHLDFWRNNMLNFLRKRTNVAYKCDRPVHFDKCKLTNYPQDRKDINLFHKRWLKYGAFCTLWRSHATTKKRWCFFFKWAFFEIRKKKGSKYKLQSTPINNSCIETGKLWLPCSCASQNTGTCTRTHTYTLHCP